MKLKSKLLLSSAVAAALIGSAALVFGSTPHATDAPQAATTAAPALTVTTERPHSVNWSRALPANGTVAAWQEASVGAEVAGLRLSEVRVNVGDAVQRGQVLAVLASEAIVAEVAQAEASVASAQAKLVEAVANAERARMLRGSGALSDQQIVQLLTAEQTARAQLAAQRATADAARLRLQQTRVIAPDDGVISARSATVGAVVSPAQELFRMIRQGRLEWRAEVASHELARLQPGTPVRVQGSDGAVIAGTVRMVAPSVDTQTRLGLIYVDLPRTASLKAGMFAKGEFDLGPAPALTVPRQAIVLRDGFSYVFSVGADQRVAQIKVTTGRRQGERVEILGVEADATLIASGVGFLNDGDVVKVVERRALLANN